MATEQKVQQQTPSQLPQMKSGLDVTPITMAEADAAGMWDMHDLSVENPFDDVPNPPKSLMARLSKRDLVWRWLSVPMVRKRGTRGWTVYSPDGEDRQAMAKGDCPPGVRVDVENKLCWREDAFLGVMPRQLHDLKQAEIQKRTRAQSERTRDHGALDDAAKRARGKITTYSVQERRGQDFPDD
jgi:hypothetical protein